MGFSGRFVLNMAQFASTKGASFENLVAITGTDTNTLCEATHLVGFKTYNAVVEKAVELCKDPYFGLHAGENLNLAAAGLIAQLTQTCAHVEQALRLSCEFANLGCSSLPMFLEENKSHFKLVLVPDLEWKENSEIAFRHTVEGVLAFIIKEFQSLTLQKSKPLQINLPWRNQVGVDEYKRVWECPVLFDRNEISMLLSKEAVQQKIITADYELFRVLIQHAEEKSARLIKEQGFAALVRQSVVKMIKPEFPSIEQVASHLNTSVRSMQRKLKEERTNYSALLDGLKKEFALSYIKRTDLNMGDIAYLLHYNDLSAFNRSFKKWTGTSPSAYRKAITA